MPQVQDNCEILYPDGSLTPNRVSPDEEIRIESNAYNDLSVAIDATVRFYLGSTQVGEVDGRIGSGYSRTMAVDFVPANFGISGSDLQSSAKMYENTTV